MYCLKFPFKLFLARACILLGAISINAHAQRSCVAEPTVGMELEYGDTIACVFDEDFDLDTYQFIGAAGDRPYIQLRNSGGDLSFNYLRLYDPDSQLIRTDYCSTSYCSIDEILSKDGAHTITVEQYSPRSGNPSRYTLELPCVSGKCAAKSFPRALGYVAVNPCRIVDTRFGLYGAFSISHRKQL